MGKTIAEKIIARVAGRAEVSPGEIVWFEPDVVGACDTREPSSSIDSIIPSIETLVGVSDLRYPGRVFLVIDHCDPARSISDSEYQASTRAWCRQHGVRFYESNVGLSFQAALELGIVQPGMFFAHHDTEVALVGGVGVLAIGALPLLELYVTGKTWLHVPPTIKINLSGTLPAGVLGRDVMHRIVGQIGPDGALCKIVEFCGSAIEHISIDSRMTMCSMTNHVGAKTGIVNPDDRTMSYMRSLTGRNCEAITSDAHATYEKTYDLDVSLLEPYVAVPPNTHSCRPLRELQGVPITQGYIGSCGGGRLEDLRAAAEILRGRRIAPGMKLFIVPVSPHVMRGAAEEGLLSILVEAGAFLSAHSCNFCSGHAGAMGRGEAAVTTNVMNIPGRMGSQEADVYLANAYVVAASALEGKITDPRAYL